MKIKIFGKELFEFKTNKSAMFEVPAMATLKESKFLPDFKKVGGANDWQGATLAFVNDMNTVANSDVKALPVQKIEKEHLTPKKVYVLKMLHQEGFTINMESEYVDKQVADFKEKLCLMNDPQYNHRGYEEIGSILLRMENRKKYSTVSATFEKFPYTTNQRIESVLKKHDYLQMGEVDQFVADMPKEAIVAMKEYNAGTAKLCNKKAVFYIIADKKDFVKTSQRRDPILLAQSPFGHFWQILGAWDKEMMFLEEL